MLNNLEIAFRIMGKGMAGIFCVVLLIMMFMIFLQCLMKNKQIPDFGEGK